MKNKRLDIGKLLDIFIIIATSSLAGFGYLFLFRILFNNVININILFIVFLSMMSSSITGMWLILDYYKLNQNEFKKNK